MRKKLLSVLVILLICQLAVSPSAEKLAQSERVISDLSSITAYSGVSVGGKESAAIINRNRFYTSEQVEKDISLLAKSYPDLIKVSSIGKSKREKNIPLIELGNGRKKACIVAGIHGREGVTINFTLLSVEEYCKACYSSSGYYGDYNIKELLSEYTLYIIPMANPDGTDICNNNELPINSSGYIDRYYYRGNANGVNLNANFPFYWNSITDKSREKGEFAESEMETKNIIRLCRDNNFEWLLDMHIVGNCIYWKDSANGAVSGDYELASGLRDNCGYYLCSATTDVNEYGGGLENWFRYYSGKPGLCIELVRTDSVTESMNLYDYNKYFDIALNWDKTKYTFAQAMS